MLAVPLQTEASKEFHQRVQKIVGKKISPHYGISGANVRGRKDKLPPVVAQVSGVHSLQSWY
jgi:hypothetical protein